MENKEIYKDKYVTMNDRGGGDRFKFSTSRSLEYELKEEKEAEVTRWVRN